MKRRQTVTKIFLKEIKVAINKKLYLIYYVYINIDHLISLGGIQVLISN